MMWMLAMLVAAPMIGQETPASPLEAMTQAVSQLDETSVDQAHAQQRLHEAMEARRRAIALLKKHPDRPQWMVDQAGDLFFRAINFRGAGPSAIWGNGGDEQLVQVTAWAREVRDLTAAAQQRSGGWGPERGRQNALKLSFLQGVSAVILAQSTDGVDQRNRLLHEAVTVLRPLAYDLAGAPGVIASCYSGVALVMIGEVEEGRDLLAQAVKGRHEDPLHATVAATQLWNLDGEGIRQVQRWRSQIPQSAVAAILLTSDAIASRQSIEAATTTYTQWRRTACSAGWSDDDADARCDQRLLQLPADPRRHRVPPELLLARAHEEIAGVPLVVIEEVAALLVDRQRARALLLAATAASRDDRVARARDACLAAADAWSPWSDRADRHMVELTGGRPDPRGLLLECAIRQAGRGGASSDRWRVFALELAASARSTDAVFAAVASLTPTGLSDASVRRTASRCLLSLQRIDGVDSQAMRTAMGRLEAAWEDQATDDVGISLRLALAQRHAEAGDHSAALGCIDRLPDDHDPLTTATYRLAVTPTSRPADQIDILLEMAAIDRDQAASFAVGIARRIIAEDRWPIEPVTVETAEALAALVGGYEEGGREDPLLVADLLRLAQRYDEAAAAYGRIESPTIEATLGHAEAIWHQTDRDLMGAMDRYRRVIASAPPSSTQWWVANLRQLEVLSAASMHLERIAPAINRLRAYDPALGSPVLRRRFQRLLNRQLTTVSDGDGFTP